MRKLRGHLTYANVVATLALIVAVAGGSTAIAISTKLKKNSVGTKQIKKGAITANKLAEGAVTNGKLAAGSVTGPKLTGTRIDVNTRPSGSAATAQCPAPEKLLGGGGNSFGGVLADSSPANPIQWGAFGSSGAMSVAYAVCLKATPGG
jgi:hypothetical protein